MLHAGAKHILKSWRSSALALVAASGIAGCAGPPALERAVIGYDQTTAKLEQQLLLLNIARMNAGEPIHFTKTSAIAATFDWSTSIGATGQTENPGSNLFRLNLGASASENPTFSIIPISGEEFTKRILTPIEETSFNFAVFWGVQLEQALRLMAYGIEFQNPDGTFKRVINNDPRNPEQFEEFRRIVTHLQWLNENQQLFVRRLAFEHTLIDNYQGQPGSEEIIFGYDKGYDWQQNSDGSYALKRLTFGRVVITNYDPRKLSTREQHAFNERIKLNPSNFVYLHIRPGDPGGDYPIEGAIKLRGLIQTLDYVAASIGNTADFDLTKDPRTGPVQSRPAETLKINVTDDPPNTGVPFVQYGDQYYSVADTEWDRSSFSILSYMFQTAIGDVEDTSIPITISK